MNKLNINSKIVLNNGLEMPVFGLGTYLSESNQAQDAVKWAIEAGYRLIDTAMIYGNEKSVGKGIKESGIDRKDIFVTTKLWNTDQGYKSAFQAFYESLKELGLDYVDLYLVHWPTADGNGAKSINKREETWKAMEEIYKSGKAKAIGVANYTVAHLEEMKKYAKILPAVDQVEFHPFLYQKELFEYCKKNDIVLEAYRPLTKGKKLDNEVFKEVAKKYSKSVAQILLRWSLQQGCIPIPKTVHKERILENVEVFDFKIAGEDMEKINSLNKNLHLCWDPTDLK